MNPRTRAPTGAILLLGLAVLRGRKAGSLTGHFHIRLHPLVPVIALLLSVSIVAASWADADTGRDPMVLLVSVFVAVFLWHEWAYRTDRATVRLTGSDLE